MPAFPPKAKKVKKMVFPREKKIMRVIAKKGQLVRGELAQMERETGIPKSRLIHIAEKLRIQKKIPRETLTSRKATFLGSQDAKVRKAIFYSPKQRGELSKIARELSVSRKYVSDIHRQMVKEGIMQPIKSIASKIKEELAAQEPKAGDISRIARKYNAKRHYAHAIWRKMRKKAGIKPLQTPPMSLLGTKKARFRKALYYIYKKNNKLPYGAIAAVARETRIFLVSAHKIKRKMIEEGIIE